MNNLKENIASQIKALRHERGMSLREVAELSFNDANRKTQISLIENERRSATVETLEKILGALNCQILIVPTEKLHIVKDALDK